MGANKSKLLETIKTHTNHKLTDLTLSDLIDEICLKREFSTNLFKDLLKDDLFNNEEEDEVKALRIHELYKRDILINFTDTNQLQDIPNLANNYVFDKFPNDYNNTYHNEYSSNVAKISNFLLSVFLNIGKSSISKEEIIELMEKFQTNITNDEKYQQKFFTILSILNSLHKLIVIDKQYGEFTRMIDTYTQFLRNYLNDSAFVIYLIREQVYELIMHIRSGIIENSQVSIEIKRNALISVFKIATCFRLVDVYLEFIIILKNSKFVELEIKNELLQFLSDVSSNYKFTFDIKEGFDIFYSVYLNYSSISSFCSDGKFLYFIVNEQGLFKIGSGKNNTIAGKLYHKNSEFKLVQPGSLTYCCGNLYFRSEHITNKPFIQIDAQTLKEVEFNLSEEESSKRMYFPEKERNKYYLPYDITNYNLMNQNRPEERSRLFSEGRYLYIFSKISELKLIEGKIENNLYGGKNLYNIDIFDPLDTYSHVTSFPITDKKSILSKNLNILDNALNGDIITDGYLIQFFTATHQITFNIINREITNISENTAFSSNSVTYDYFNNLLWIIGSTTKDNNSTTNVKFANLTSSNIFPSKITNGYLQLSSFKPLNLVENFRTKFLGGNNQLSLAKESNLYNFFVKPKFSTNTCDKNELDNNNIISNILLGLSSKANRQLNFADTQTNMIMHLFEDHVLNVNERTVKQLICLLEIYSQEYDQNQEVETKLYIISSILSLVKANIVQLRCLNFNKFENFMNDFSVLKSAITQIISMISNVLNNQNISNSFSLNLISELYDTYYHLNTIFEENNLFDIKFFSDNLLTSSKSHLKDLKSFVLTLITKQCEKSVSENYVQDISNLLIKILERNNNQVKEMITNMNDQFDEILPISDFSFSFEGLFTPILKDLFNAFREMTKIKEENELEKQRQNFTSKYNSFDKLLNMIFKYSSDLIGFVFNFITEIKTDKIELYDKAINNINLFINNNSYCFRLYLASTCLLNILITDKLVIFKKWHVYYDSLVLIDRHINNISNNRKKLIGKEYPQEIMYLFETSHPIETNLDKSKRITFENPQNILLEFDPFCSIDASSSFIIRLSNGSDSKEIKYEENNFTNSYHENVVEININFKTGATSSNYGVKMRIVNKSKDSAIFSELYNLNLSILVNSIKTFFFYNFRNDNKLNKETEELLESKLFSGGINELLEFETSSEEYRMFIESLKTNDNFLSFEKKISTETGEHQDNETDPFQLYEVLDGDNELVNKAIKSFQKSLKKRFPWINLGGEKAEKILRGAFSIVLKHERLWNLFYEVCNKISEKEEELGDLSNNDLSQINNYDFFLMIWSEISRLRQWYNEQIKDLAESNNSDFENQNTAFINQVLDKCKFLFSINPPPSKKIAKNTSKVKFSEIYNKATDVLNSKIDNELLKVNIINWKKNLMFNKIEEAKGDFTNVKSVISNITNCLKLTKISIPILDKALREINTKAKFREIALALLNTLTNELTIEDSKHYLIKNIVVILRKIYNKKIISVDEEIKCASPSILNNINSQFHNFIAIIYANILNSTSSFYIADYLDCLLWNLRARNHRFLYDIQILKGLFKHSKNILINSAWKNLINNKVNFYRKISFLYKYDEKHLSWCLLEFFSIFSSMIVGRIVEENEHEKEESSTGFFKKKSSVLDSGSQVDDLIYDIVDIVVEKISEFINSYVKINEDYKQYLENIPKIDKIDEHFVNNYCDEYYLNSFLLVLYKYTVNQSNLMLKHLKNPLLISNLFVLLQFSSPKNKYTLSNFFKIILKNIENEDLLNSIIILKKNQLYNTKEYLNISDDISNVKKVTINYILNIIYQLRKGIFENYYNSSIEFEESYYIIDLLRNMYNLDKWRPTIDDIIIESLQNFEENKKRLLIPILSFINGDFDDLHYGSYVTINFEKENPRTFYQRFKDKDDGALSRMLGYIIGFSETELRLSEITDKKAYKNSIENGIKFNREESSKFAVIAIIDKETYSKHKIKGNEIEILSKPIQNINPQIIEKIQITNQMIIDLLNSISVNILKNETSNLNNSFNCLLDYYIFSLLVKILGSIAKENGSSILSFIEKLGMKHLISICSSLDDIPYKCSKSNQSIFNIYLKRYLDTKGVAEFNFNDPIQDKKKLIYIDASNDKKYLKFYTNQQDSESTNINIIYTNLTMTCESINKIKKFPLVRFKDPKIKSYYNSVLFVDYNTYTNEEVMKIDDINVVFVVPKDFSFFVKDVFHHPYFILDCDSEYLNLILTTFTLSNKYKLTKSNYQLNKEVRNENFKENESIIYVNKSESNINDLVSIAKEMVNKYPTTIKQGELLLLLKKIILTFLRYSIITYLHNDRSILNIENFDNLLNIFKITFFDNCQQVNMYGFDLNKIEFLNDIFTCFYEFSQNNPSCLFFKLNKNSTTFNCYTLIHSETLISSQIQSELLEFYFDKKISSLSENIDRIKFLPILLELLKVTLVTIKNDTLIFKEYARLFLEYFVLYCKQLVKDQVNKEHLFNFIAEIEELGLKDIFKYSSIYLMSEIEYTYITKILINLSYEIVSRIEKTAKRLKIDYEYEKLTEMTGKTVLGNLFNDLNIIRFKSKYSKLVNTFFFQHPDIQKNLVTEVQIPLCNYTFERRLNFDECESFRLKPLNKESSSKIILSNSIDENRKYKLNEFISDNDRNNQISINKYNRMTIISQDLCNYQLKSCGYNERWRLGNETLSDYQYTFIPIEVNLDKTAKIKKVVSAYTTTLVLTTDNKVYSCGESYCSGLESLSKSFTLENSWNKIAQKEKVIDIVSGENTGMIMVTEKGIYCSGYNCNGVFGDCCPSGNYTTGVQKINSVPFKTSKVVQVSLGNSHVIYRLDDGSLWGAGCNNCYELNFDTCNTYPTISKLNFPNNLICERVSCGYHCSLFVMRERDGGTKLYSCGDYSYGQSGQTSTSDRRFKKCSQVEDINFRWCKNRYLCSFAISTDNQLYTFGYNSYGNLAHGDSNYRYVPTKVEFFNGRNVLDADINEKNILVRCLENGQIKLYSCGYSSYGCIGTGDGLSSYVYLPVEVTTLTGEFISKISLGATGYASFFIKTDISKVDNPYEFKCDSCSNLTNDICYITKKDNVNINVCEKCMESSSENIMLGIQNINFFHNLKVMNLPDLPSINSSQPTNMENEVHMVKCEECKQEINNNKLYLIAEEPRHIFLCSGCYRISSIIDVPKFVYVIKKPVNYQNLPFINSKTILGYDKVLKLQICKFMNSKGCNRLIEENNSIFSEVVNQTQNIKPIHLTEYLKVIDSDAVIKDPKLVFQESKKINCFSSFSQQQFNMLEIISRKIDKSMKILRNLIDHNINNKLKDIYVTSLPYLSKKSRIDILERLLYTNCSDVSPDNCTIRISRGKATKLKQKSTNVDTSFTSTIFSQIIKELKNKNISISQYRGNKNQRLFKTELVGEGATDAGGPFREVMNIACDELQSSYLDLFIPTPNNRSSSGTDREKWTINPSAKTSLHLEIYKHLGRIFGWAMRSMNFLNLDLPSFVWKQIMNLSLDMSDLERIDIHTANFLDDLNNLEEKGIDKDTFDSIYDQSFTTILSNGKEVELIPGKKLTFENRKEYRELALKCRFDECAPQIQSIREGLIETIDKGIFLIINWKDLEERICGSLIVDIPFLEKNTDYEGYSKTDDVINWFWKALKNFSNEERILYLKFVWGRSRLPLTAEGFDRKHKITKYYSNHPDISLPLSHTCFFTIDIPSYSSYEILYNKLLYAIRFCGEIDNDFNATQALEEI